MTHPPAPKARSYYWLAFAISFAILALASCGGVALMIGLSPSTLAELQSTSPSWTPPPTPTDLPADATVPAVGQSPPGGSDAQSRLQPGTQARNVASSVVNIRRTPGYLGKGAEDIVAQMEPGTVVTILTWPQVADQLNWWQIRYTGPAGSTDGWVAESTASGVQILSPQ